MGDPSAFHHRNIATFFGVYVANRPSLARSHFGVFIFDVPDFNPSFNPRTANFGTHSGGIFAVSDKIFRNKYIIHGAIPSSCSLFSFS